MGNAAASSSDLFEAVKQCDLRRVLEARGYTFNHEGKTAIRDERTPSCQVGGRAAHRWHDFGTQEGGDLIDFLQVAEGLTLEQAREEAASILGVTYHGGSGLDRIKVDGQPAKPAGSPSPAARKTTSAQTPVSAPEQPDLEHFDDVVEQAHEALIMGLTPEAQAARAYLASRGLDLDAEDHSSLRTARVGVIDESVTLPASMSRYQFQGRIILPYFDQEGRAVFLNARAAADVDQAQRYRKPSDAQQTVPFNRPSLRGGDHLILVEGELDALALTQALGPDTPVLASGGGRFRDDHLQPLAKRYPLVFLCFDNDKAGEANADAARKTLEAAGAAALPLHLPGDCKDASEALAASGAALGAILRRQIDQALGKNDSAYIITTFLEELLRRHERPFPAYTTGMANVDRLLGGGYHEGLHIIGGITGGGKTSFAVRLALTNALAGRHVIYASYEQSKHELWSRLAAGVTRLPYEALKRGTYHDRDGRYPASDLIQVDPAWPDLLQAAERIRVIEAGDALSRRGGEASIEAMQKLAERIKRDTGVPPLLVVDYLQRVPAPELHGRDIRERVAHVAGMLQVAIAREVGSPVVALSSLNRDGYGKGGEASIGAKLSALKESGEVEYTAYTVGLLSRFKEGDEPRDLVPGPLDKWKPVLFDLVKNREGETAQVYAKWTPQGDKWAEHVSLADKVNW